ncbi:Trehalase [Dirofilaria immitis]|nr:Trehalase [Dirofilaria immitis]
MTKLEAIREYHPKEGWFKEMIEYGKYGVMLTKDKLNSLDDNKLQMIPFMKQHLAAVDFIRAVLLACKALQKRGIMGIGNINIFNITVGDIVTSDGKSMDTVINENINKGESSDAKMMISTESNNRYIAIPNNEDVISSTVEVPEWACDERHSPNYIIYCQGDLLHAVMMLNIFKDSKTFVDKPLKRNPAEVAEDFKKNFHMILRQMIRKQYDNLLMKILKKKIFVNNRCELVDWEERPEKLLSIADPQLRQFALNVMNHPERHSLLYVPYEFVVPGGRFREFYYWDTYWVIKGLLASGMQETSRRMILNFEYLVRTIGFIPNGGRVYYLRRSQPPFFIPMVYEYYMATEDDDFLRSTMNTMEMEFSFWKLNRMINVTMNKRNHSVFHYRADSNVPRRKLWRDIASAAESGWDFSSRWFQNRRSMDTIVTSDIIPVDLNAFMYWNMKILAHLQGELGNLTRRDELNRERSNFVDTFEAVFFDTREGAWFDLNVKTGEHYDDAYPSLAVPLLLNVIILMKGTNQQWDYPNGWAPINHMIIEGLRKSNSPTMQQRAFEIANKWINRNYALYQKDHKMWKNMMLQKNMYEQLKYGFGWTNGVVLDLLVTFSKRAVVKPTGGVTDVHGIGRTDIPGTNRTILTRYLGTGGSFDLLLWFMKRILLRALTTFLKCKSFSSSSGTIAEIKNL